MTLTALARDVLLTAGGEMARFPASLILKERAYLSALQAGDPDAARASGWALRDAVETLSDTDRDRLGALDNSAGNSNERAFLRARLGILDEWLGIAHSFDDGAERGSDAQSPAQTRGRSEQTSRPAGLRGADQVVVPTFGHRDDIQGLRAVAVLLVALAHAGVTVLQGGFVGVDVFFVLSGFLITGLLMSDACNRCWVSLTDFYMRRARRILPAATLTLIVTDIAAYELLNVVRAKQYLQDSIPSVLFGANIHFAAIGTDYFANGQPPSPFQHFWSLAVEEQFYVVWPALFIVLLGLSLHRFGRRPSAIRVRDLRRVLVAVVTLVTVSLIWSVRNTAHHPAAAYFSTPGRVWELGLGAALALGSYRLSELSRRSRAWLGWLGLACVAVAAVDFSAATPFPGYTALLPTIGAALLIVSGVGEGSHRFSAVRVLSWRPMRFIGDRSYAFYLWHWPVLVIAAQRAGHSLSLGTNVLLLSAAFALSVVSYALYEKPLRFAALTRKAPSIVLWVGSVAAVLFLATTWISAIDTREARLVQAAQATPAPVLSAAPVTRTRSTVAARLMGPAEQVLPAVSREVRLESAGRPLPSVLQPPVTQLLHDLPRLAPSCSAHAGQTTSALCRLGVSSSSRTLVLLGDSHAEMWVSDLVHFAQRYGWAVVPLIKSGCMPPVWVGPQSTGECRTWFAWALRMALALHPGAAVVTGDYSWIGPGRQSELTAGLDTALRAMRRLTAHVIVMGDVPSRNEQPVDCLLRAHATATGCSQSLGVAQPALTSLVAQLATTDKVTFLDPTGWFCSQGECPLVVGNLITYRDTNHISQVYATALSAVMAAAIRHAITGPIARRG